MFKVAHRVMYVIFMNGTKSDISTKLNKMAQLVINTDELMRVTLKVKKMFEDAGGTDQVAKGSTFAETLLAAPM
jgi:hypothetical protein